MNDECKDKSEALTVSVPEAAKMLGVGLTAAYTAVRDGTIPSLRIGRNIRISRKKLLEFINGEADEQEE